MRFTLVPAVLAGFVVCASVQAQVIQTVAAHDGVVFAVAMRPDGR